MSWAGNVVLVEEKRNVYRLLVGKPEGKRSLGRPRGRWWITLIWILERWGGVQCIGPAQDKGKWRAIVNVVMNHRVP
jgi:hypothetical protein